MLYEGMALFSGALIAVMVTANSLLAEQMGNWMSLVIIHVCGLLTVTGILLARRKRIDLRAPGTPWYFYISGVVGVLTTLLNNLCFEPLGATLMLAMCVVGQLLCSNLIDHFGWFGMRRYPFARGKLAGYTLMAFGLGLMTFGNTQTIQSIRVLLFIFLALATGVLLAFTNTLNAALGKRVGVFSGALVNYLTGFATSLVCITVAGGWMPLPGGGLNPFLFLGGVLGVLIITVTNVALPRVPVVYITIILFTGQVLMGIGIDAINGTPLTLGKAAGCALIAVGLVYNIRQDRHA